MVYSDRDYSNPAYKAWRKQIFGRDKYMCQMPGCTRRNTLQAHHIKRWASNPVLRFEVSNGITLCKKCHSSIWQKEEQHEALFMSIVAGKNGASTMSEVIRILYGK